MGFVAPLVPVPERPPQHYANHRHSPVATAVAGSFGVLGLALAVVWGLKEAPWLPLLSLVSLALAVMTLVVMSRTYTVRLQDRIIRLEMRIRLERLGRGSAFDRLSTAQITALRFAADRELPALVDRALSDRLTSDQIKRAVTDWQGDYFRT